MIGKGANFAHDFFHSFVNHLSMQLGWDWDPRSIGIVPNYHKYRGDRVVYIGNISLSGLGAGPSQGVLFAAGLLLLASP